MKTLTVAIALLLTSVAFGQTEVPNTFESGQPAVAGEVNENFDALAEAIDQNVSDIQAIPAGAQGEVGPQGIQGNQGNPGADLSNEISILQGEQAIQNDRLDELESAALESGISCPCDIDRALDFYIAAGGALWPISAVEPNPNDGPVDFKFRYVWQCNTVEIEIQTFFPDGKGVKFYAGIGDSTTYDSTNQCGVSALDDDYSDSIYQNAADPINALQFNACYSQMLELCESIGIKWY